MHIDFSPSEPALDQIVRTTLKLARTNVVDLRSAEIRDGLGR